MSNRPVIPKEYQQAEFPQGFTHGEWAETKRLVDEGYARFWNKRGGIPERRAWQWGVYDRGKSPYKKKNTPKDSG